MLYSDYQGVAKLHAHTFTPFRRPNGGELLMLCKQTNQCLEKCYILIEHKTGTSKLFEIIAQHYHNRLQHYNLKMKLFTGLVNFEISLWFLQEI